MTYSSSNWSIMYPTGSTSTSFPTITTVSTASTANAIWIGPSTGVTTIASGTAGGTWLGGTGTSNISYDYYYTSPTQKYDDLIKNVRPGTAWFKDGTVVELQGSLVFSNRNDEAPILTFDPGTVFIYMGVQEDLVVGKECHWFLAPSGEFVQYSYWVYDLSWRYDIKRRFKEIEDEQNDGKGQQG